MGVVQNAYSILVGKPQGKRRLGRSRRRWEDNIRIVLREIGWEVVEWIHLARDRDKCGHGNEPSGSIKYREFFE
jgi:hypothetical protein